jgi:hypothetical protein
MWVALILPRRQWLRNEIRLCPWDNDLTPIGDEAELKYVPLRPLIECQKVLNSVKGQKMNVLSDALDTVQHLCRKGSMFRLERPPRRP